MATTVNNFAKDLQALLEQYGDEVYNALGPVAEDVAGEAKKKVKAASPRRSGKYKSGWRTQTDKSGRSVAVTVYNGNKPGLPHLLEYGHALRGGGRSTAYEHIAPVEEWAAEEVVTRLEREIQ